MKYELEQLHVMILAMVQSACGKNQAGAVTDAIIELIKQDREVTNA